MPVVRPAKSQPATPSKVTRFSYWSIKPWFLTEGKLVAVLGIPSSWGFLTVHSFINLAQQTLIKYHIAGYINSIGGNMKALIAFMNGAIPKEDTLF